MTCLASSAHLYRSRLIARRLSGTPSNRRSVVATLALLAFGCVGASSITQHPSCFNAEFPAQCAAAIKNAPKLARIQVGMTVDAVRQIMGHEPERRDADASGEVWYFIQDYDAKRMTAIVFTDGKVSALRSVPWSS